MAFAAAALANESGIDPSNEEMDASPMPDEAPVVTPEPIESPAVNDTAFSDALLPPVDVNLAPLEVPVVPLADAVAVASGVPEALDILGQRIRTGRVPPTVLDRHRTL